MRLIVLAALLLVSHPLFAEAQTHRLQGLNETERGALAPLLDRGVVALIESNGDSSLKQVCLAAIVRAPAQAVFSLVSNPDVYQAFMPNISAVHVLERHPTMLAYEWTWHGVLFDLHGSNAMTLYAPRRIDVETTRGDLGRGRFRWEFFPLAADRTLVVHTLFADLTTANYITRQLIESDRTMMHAMNVSSGFVLLMGVKTKIEQLAGTGNGQRPSVGISGSGALGRVASLANNSMLPLLRRGELALIQMDARQRLRQVTLFGRVAASAADARTVIFDPSRYPQIMPNVESTSVVSRTENEVVFDWELSFPVFNVEGQMRMTQETDGHLSLEAPSGDLQGGRWSWEFAQVGGSTVLAYSSRANFARANWVLGRLIQREPFFLHGVACSSNLVAIRAIQRHFD